MDKHLSKQMYNAAKKMHIKTEIEVLIGEEDAQEIFDEVDAEHNLYGVENEICRLLCIKRLAANGVPAKDIKAFVSYGLENAVLSALKICRRDKR